MKKILTLLSAKRSRYANPTRSRVSIPANVQEKIYSRFSIANGLTVKRVDDSTLDTLNTFMVGDYRFRWSWTANNLPVLLSLDTTPRNVTAWIIETNYRPVMDGSNVLLFASQKIAQDYLQGRELEVSSYNPVTVKVTGKDALLGKVSYEYARYILSKNK